MLNALSYNKTLILMEANVKTIEYPVNREAEATQIYRHFQFSVL
jgi:hypothetical protein